MAKKNKQKKERPRTPVPRHAGRRASAGSRTGCARQATGTTGGPYLSERQWGTVREDYSANGTAWEYLPHDHARSRAYRWGEDGLAGFSDVEQLLCLGLSLWNGRDPILKERIFGLTGNQGNHGEDAKEYWWYLDATPTHSWNRWRYHYPQARFPTRQLVEENAARGKQDPEFELLDTGIFDDDRYWIVEADYAKADAHDLLLTFASRTRAPRPTRCTSCRRPGTATPGRGSSTARSPSSPLPRASCTTEHPFLGALELHADVGPDGNAPSLLFCDNETNDERIFGTRRAGLPEGRHQRSRRLRRRLGQPRPQRHEGRVLVPGRGRTRGDRRAAAAAAARRQEEIAMGGLRRRGRKAPAGGRRVLCRADAAARVGRRGERDAPGVRRDAVEQAALLLRRRALARRRPDPAASPGLPARRTQRALEELRGVRHHVDARQVGVPVVRGLGHGVPLHRARPRRPGLRQVPADAPLPGVVPASERGDAGIRVGVRRRQPSGAGPCRARGVRDRRRPGHRLPQPHLRQAARQLHLVGEPSGRGRLERLRRRVPGARQHRADRPLPPAARLRARAVRCDRLDGVVRAQHGGDRLDPEQARPTDDGSRGQVPRALRAHLRCDPREGPLGRRRRLLLRPAAAARRHRRAGARAVDGRHPPAHRVRRDRRAGAPARRVGRASGSRG